MGSDSDLEYSIRVWFTYCLNIENVYEWKWSRRKSESDISLDPDFLIGFRYGCRCNFFLIAYRFRSYIDTVPVHITVLNKGCRSGKCSCYTGGWCMEMHMICVLCNHSHLFWFKIVITDNAIDSLVDALVEEIAEIF